MPKNWILRMDEVLISDKIPLKYYAICLKCKWRRIFQKLLKVQRYYTIRLYNYDSLNLDDVLKITHFVLIFLHLRKKKKIKMKYEHLKKHISLIITIRYPFRFWS